MGGDKPVEIFLSAMDGDWRVPADLGNISAGGAQVKVPVEEPLLASVGKTLTLWLIDHASGIELPIEARLVHRGEQGAIRVLGLEFVDLRTVGSLLHPVIGKMFNRRGAFRVVSSKAEGPLPITLLAPPDLNVPLQVGAMVDVSTGGMAVDVPLAFEDSLSGRETVECLFRLPAQPQSSAASGRILHRTLRADNTVRYGIQFQNTDDTAFRRTHDALLGYVIRRQREMAEEHELTHGTGIPLGALSRTRR